MAIINGQEISSNVPTRTQVYYDTHDGAGNRLPLMNRSFISFSYGGKWVEDFNLIATIDGGSMNRKLYADFTDNTTDSDIWDGSIYWSTHFKANTLELVLATDSITEEQYNQVQNWLRPGNIQELILAEHPNRAILARVGAVPEYHMLPFEKIITVKVAGVDYETSTTEYRGTINLKFTMDDPFWYSLKNILDDYDPNKTVPSDGPGNKYNVGEWTDPHGNTTQIVESREALKIITEDHVPAISMLDNNMAATSTNISMLLGNEAVIIGSVALNGDNRRVGTAIVNNGYIASLLASSTEGVTLPATALNDNDLPSSTVHPYYCFYGGNALCRPLVTFSIPITRDLSTKYVKFPYNSSYGSLPYSRLIVRSKNLHKLYFTTPSVVTAYNMVIKILSDASYASKTWEDLRKAIRDGVKHYAARAYAIEIINSRSNQPISATLITACKDAISDKFFNPDQLNMIFQLDCQTGKCLGIFSYRYNGEYIEAIENVGDMIKYNDLILEDQNQFDENGRVSTWTSSHPEYSYQIYSDTQLNNFNILYKYLYY